jgi:hypothetical protein
MIALGFLLVFKPNLTKDKICKFYNNYPIVRLAGEKQLKSRSTFIIILGIVIIISGILFLASLFFIDQ